MELLQSIFGKDKDISREDIENIILNKVRESLEIEFKEIYDLEKDKEKGIIKPIISFLNSNGKGLLFLGIREEKALAKELKPVKKEIIKDAEQLRAIITSNIVAIPILTDFPKLNIIEIKINGEGNVFIIEIKNHDNRYVYYSKITNQAYIRRGNESFPLKLIEVIELIAKKNHARVFVKFDNKLKETNNRYEFELAYFNDGLEPGRYVTSSIKLFYEDENLNIIIKGTNVRDISHLNEDAKKTYQITLAYPPNSIWLYPKTTTVIGNVIVSPKKDFELKMIIQTYEDRGLTNQEVLITKKEGIFNIKEIESSFYPYISI
jgi:hypothetical protein